MANESAPECLQHSDNRYIQVRQDYMAIYQNENKAKIIRVLETWTNSKRAEWYKSAMEAKEAGTPVSPPDMWITMSYQQFSQFMYGTVKVETIRKTLDALLTKDKHIERRVHPEKPYGPPQYRLNIGLLQDALKTTTPPDLSGDPPNLPGGKDTPTQGVNLPGGAPQTYRGGPPKLTPTQGAKLGTSNNTTKNTQEDGKNTQESFLPQDEQFSDSQSIQPTNEKKEVDKDQEIAELKKQLASLSEKQSQWLSEDKAHQSTVSQASLIPEPPKPENKHTFPDLRAGLNERDVSKPLTKAQQKALDAAEERAEFDRIKGRERDLWAMAKRVAGEVVETTYATNSIKAMAKTTMPLEDIEIIMQRFAKAGKFDLTPIANYLPTYAARKKNKQPEPSNIIPFSGRYQAPQQEVRVPGMSKNYNDAGGHLNPADYDEEPYVAVRTK